MSMLHKLFLALSLATFAGCTTQIKVEQIVDPSVAGNGIVYYLPMVEYEVALTRQLTKCDAYDAEKPDKELKIAVKLSATLTPRYVQDPEKGFLLQYDALSGPTKTTDITVELYENGALKSINADATDETRQIVANVVSGVSSLGLSIAGVSPLTRSRGDAPVQELCHLPIRNALKTFATSEDLISTIEDEIVSLKAEIQDNKDPGKLKALRAALGKAETALAGQVKQRKAELDKLVDTQVYVIRPRQSKTDIELEPSAALQSKWFTTGAINNGKGEVITAIKATLAAEGGLGVVQPVKMANEALLCPTGWSTAPCKPIHFRQPATGLVRVCRGATCYSDGNPLPDSQNLLVAASTIPQLGVQSTLLFRNGIFESNQLKVSFLPSGGLEKLQAKTQSSAKEATATFKETADAVAKYRDAKRGEDKQKLNEETDKLKAEKAKLDAQLELEKSRKALDAFRAE